MGHDLFKVFASAFQSFHPVVNSFCRRLDLPSRSHVVSLGQTIDNIFLLGEKIYGYSLCISGISQTLCSLSQYFYTGGY